MYLKILFYDIHADDTLSCEEILQFAEHSYQRIIYIYIYIYMNVCVCVCV